MPLWIPFSQIIQVLSESTLPCTLLPPSSAAPGLHFALQTSIAHHSEIGPPCFLGYCPMRPTVRMGFSAPFFCLSYGLFLHLCTRLRWHRTRSLHRSTTVEALMRAHLLTFTR